MKKLVKMMVMAIVVLAAYLAAMASPLALPAKVLAEKVGARMGGHVAGEAVVRGGTALADVTAKREAAKVAARTAAGRIAGKATPGKILAVGCGVALVAGAHEMADGVQTICENVGEAVRDNPDAAKGVLHELLELPKVISALIVTCAVATLGWLLWPFLTLVRNWIRLVSARKVHALAVAGEGGAAVSAPGEGRVGTSAGFTRIGFLWIAAFLLLTALGVWRLAVDGVPMGRLWETWSGTGERAARRAKVVAELRKGYEEAVERHHGEFLAEVDSTAQAEFGRVRACIPGVVGQFGAMSRCAALVKAMALDKCRGGTRTEESVKRDLEATYYSGLYAARDRVVECYQRLAENLDSDRRAFAAQIEGELATAELPGDDVYKELLADCGERIEKSKLDLSVGQVVAGISVVVEAVFIRQTVAAISRLLGRTAARQAGSMVAGVGAAAADGPFPFGDIIGGAAVIGCTAWTVWDVRKATKVLPARLGETLESVTRDCERQCRDEICKLGEKMVASYRVDGPTTKGTDK